MLENNHLFRPKNHTMVLIPIIDDKLNLLKTLAEFSNDGSVQQLESIRPRARQMFELRSLFFPLDVAPPMTTISIYFVAAPASDTNTSELGVVTRTSKRRFIYTKTTVDGFGTFTVLSTICSLQTT
jgi:hypothetical protein